mmetsp:Transcript_28324/g.61553  ORF Transcript_28324/g.61553 Transcript_28324/m.61553 type:complete len:240 (+) Transcript_28324:88-807(+)
MKRRGKRPDARTWSAGLSNGPIGDDGSSSNREIGKVQRTLSAAVHQWAWSGMAMSTARRRVQLRPASNAAAASAPDERLLAALRSSFFWARSTFLFLREAKFSERRFFFRLLSLLEEELLDLLEELLEELLLFFFLLFFFFLSFLSCDWLLLLLRLRFSPFLPDSLAINSASFLSASSKTASVTSRFAGSSQSRLPSYRSSSRSHSHRPSSSSRARILASIPLSSGLEVMSLIFTLQPT